MILTTSPSLVLTTSLAGLLIFMGEEDSFWMLAYIVEKLLPNYFDATLMGSRIDMEILGTHDTCTIIS